MSDHLAVVSELRFDVEQNSWKTEFVMRSGIRKGIAQNT
jgi:hypothetical protein